jgi:hypothetical protein
MLPSVLFARDKWLKPGGLILPSHATVYIYDMEIYHTRTHNTRKKLSDKSWTSKYFQLFAILFKLYNDACS